MESVSCQCKIIYIAYINMYIYYDYICIQKESVIMVLSIGESYRFVFSFDIIPPFTLIRSYHGGELFDTSETSIEYTYLCQ